MLHRYCIHNKHCFKMVKVCLQIFLARVKYDLTLANQLRKSIKDVYINHDM